VETEIGFLLLGMVPVAIVISVFYLVLGKNEYTEHSEN